MINKNNSRSIVLLFGLSLSFAVQAMTIEVHGNSIYATGRIGDEFVKFKEVLAQPSIERVVLVNSPGGDLWAGMQVGNLIREKGVKTVIAGYCMSACSIMFMGGKERSFSDAFRPTQTYIGIHGPHDTYTKSVLPAKAVQILYFMEKSMGERFNAEVMKMALYHMDDAGAMLKVYDAKRLPKRVAYHCRSSKTLRKNCTDIPDQDALTLGIVTTNDFTAIDLPVGFRKPPNVVGRELNQPLADSDEYFRDLSAKQCTTDGCRKLIADFVGYKENKALAVPIGAAGLGIAGNQDSETDAFSRAIRFCNHVKDRPARLCETQIVNGFDVRDLYLSAVAMHIEVLTALSVPPEKYYANEEYGGVMVSVNGLRTQNLSDIPPQHIDGIKTFSTQELASALKSTQAPVLIDVINIDDAIPSALTLLFGGLAHDDPTKELDYEARFSELLKLLSPDTNNAIVFYSKKRDWHAANAALRAKKLGYAHVGWYRGGLNSWKAANLPVATPIVRAVVQ
ncbi:rhodanese-like domain-containing protein [Propionivibrio sp.]|uniref:rhodanese-like domain-containing protein n=1 Tax=Propionivibrio sp. TaxID=2212460 RepID=UPI00261B2A54|nr:rhodanese-like domain-containing protein [Propionivibrio sp.]